MSDDFESKFKDKTTKVWQVYKILKDKQWHCRECEYSHVQTTQIAGGAGIQGLQRGTRARQGMDIKSSNNLCSNCGRTTRHDRWTGQFHESIPTPSMSPRFAKRVIDLLGSRDVVERTERPVNQLTIDHKVPMIRWNSKVMAKQTDYTKMNDKRIRATFQLLKSSNGSASHNLLKSRSCEQCFKTGKRGKPFGITFFYKGGPRWDPRSKKDPKGCIGCGWHDFDEWRKQINKKLGQQP